MRCASSHTHGLMLFVESEPKELQGLPRYHAQGVSRPTKENQCESYRQQPSQSFKSKRQS
ncbi:hypothetical protein EYF80_028943 [Liparis tanakae]|uniref:Uncharacterized protein n=1 Tax=Liparis tanakae TaxID=230148 RepID=A0A4Z2H564_9TELE|nr:hypothetical protein EYF80_028943 [Liparis tanakae]